MPNNIQASKYITLENLSCYDQLIKNYIELKNADSIKAIILSPDGMSLEFYTTTTITPEVRPAYVITIPQGGGSSDFRLVVENSYVNFPVIGNEATVYIDKSANKTYRWDNADLKYYCIGSDWETVQQINGNF